MSARELVRRFVFVATAWGPQKGGINALNMDLCAAVAEEQDCDVACVVENADPAALKDAERKSVALIPFSVERRQLDDANRLARLVARAGFPDAWWIGHDMATGELAVAAAGILHRPVAILHHMHHLTYKRLEGEHPIKVQQREQKQRALLKSANLVVAVGPSLRSSAEDLLRAAGQARPLIEIIPGLCEVAMAERPNKFHAVILGRFEDSGAKTKQLRLSVAAFGKAARDPAGPLGQHPLLTAYGAEKSQKELNELAETHGARRVDVHALPFETDRQTLLTEVANKSTVMMLSWYEAFGLVAWEAIAAGVPLVLSRGTGAYRQLQRVLGECVDDFVESVSLKASTDANSIVTEDVDTVATALQRIAADPAGATARARDLRQRLHNAGFTWKAAAQTLLDACSAFDGFYAHSSPMAEQDLIFVEHFEERTSYVALSLIVDQPDQVRAGIRALCEKIARLRGVSDADAARIREDGVSAALDLSRDDVRELILQFILFAPWRAYATVHRKRGLTDEVRHASLAGLLGARLSKRSLALRT